MKYKLQIRSAMVLPNDFFFKKRRRRRREQKFRAVLEEAQVLVAFETLFFNFALKTSGSLKFAKKIGVMRYCKL